MLNCKDGQTGSFLWWPGIFSCTGAHTRGIWNSRKYLNSSILGLSGNNYKSNFKSQSWRGALNITHRATSYLKLSRNLLILTFKIKTNSTWKMLLSRYPIKEIYNRNKSHFNDIWRGFHSFRPASVILFQIISSSPSKYNGHILQKKETSKSSKLGYMQADIEKKRVSKIFYI